MIRDCNSVTDVSSLGNVHELTIDYPTNSWDDSKIQYLVTGVSSLGNVHTLKLSGLDITDADIATLRTVIWMSDFNNSQCECIGQNE